MPELPPDEAEETTASIAVGRWHHDAGDTLLDVEFPTAMRGYDRAAVDSWREKVRDLVERLEEQQPRDSAVKRALDEVGHETSAILQRAIEAAEDITARSRSQAEGRLQKAEREADATLRDAEERMDALESGIQAIWEQRARLIEELRQLADEVLSVADDALERMPLPQAAAGPETAVGEGKPVTEEVPAVEAEAEGPAEQQPHPG